MNGRNGSFRLGYLAFIASIAIGISGCSQFSLYDKFPQTTEPRQSAEPLSISPVSVMTPTSTSVAFAASGGTEPYQYTVSDGDGSIDKATGLFLAPSTPGQSIVTVTDADGDTASATVRAFAVAATGPLTISPDIVTLSGGTSLAFSAVGGTPPYVYSVTSGGGSIDSASGVYLAPAGPDTVTVTVVDSASGTSSAGVTVLASGGGLAISPASATIAASTKLTFGAANGTAPYTYSIVSGSGVIDAATGVYQAPPTAANVTVRVTDNLGATSDASITVVAPASSIVIAPVAPVVSVGSTINFTANGGSPPYSYSILSGGAGGTIAAATGVYVAPLAAGTDTVRVTDVYGGVSDATVTIVAASQLIISPATLTISTGNTYQFGATGGVLPHTFSRISGAGNMSAGGLYTAPGSSSVDIVRVTDGAGSTSDATVNVVAGGPLAINPTSAPVPEGGTVTFAGSGGTPSYVFTIVSGTGSIGAYSGTYTANGAVGAAAATVKLTDSAAASVTASVDVVPAAPSNLSVVNGSALHLNLSWTNNTVDAGAVVQIERKTGGAGSYDVLATVPSGQTTYVDGNGTPLSPNTVYVYRVRAVDGSLRSPYSNESFGLT